MICPRCKKNETEKHPVFGVIPCRPCRDEQHVQREKPPEFYSQTKKDRVQQDRDKHEKDIIPPYWANKPNPDFIKAYPELAPDYFSEEELKQYEKA